MGKPAYLSNACFRGLRVWRNGTVMHVYRHGYDADVIHDGHGRCRVEPLGL